jgi:hypothetical protein
MAKVIFFRLQPHMDFMSLRRKPLLMPISEPGVAAALTFLKVNGIRVPEDDGSIYQALIEIANKQQDKAGLAEVLRKLVSTQQ